MYYRDLLLSSSLAFYCCDIFWYKILTIIYGVLPYSLLIVGLGFTDISKKNCYEKNPEKTNQPILRKTLNWQTKGGKYSQATVIS